MGDLHNMEKIKVSGHASGQMTGQQLADKLKKSPDAMRKYFVRVAEKRPDIFSDTSWSLDRTLTAEQVAALSGQKQRTKNKSFNPQRHKSLPPAPENPETAPARTFFDRLKSITSAQIRTALFNILAVGVVVGHGVLIWVECSQLWGMVGAIGGGVVFTVVLLAVLLASDPSKNRTSAYALWFMACVDTAAFWVHYPSFKTYSVSDAVTVGVCVFICACSFIALVLFQDSKLS